MKLNLGTVLHILFPPSPDEQLTQACTPEQFSLKLHPRVHETICSLAAFSDPQVQAAIHLVKFHKNKHATALLGALCAAYLKTLPRDSYIVIPIPLSAKRRRIRGHNQATTILLDTCKQLPTHTMQITEDTLYRTRDTVPQTSLNRTARLSNLTGAFALNEHEKESLRDAHIIVFDDVTTTGATLRAAAEVLQKARPASIQCIALAH